MERTTPAATVNNTSLFEMRRARRSVQHAATSRADSITPLTTFSAGPADTLAFAYDPDYGRFEFTVLKPLLILEPIALTARMHSNAMRRTSIPYSTRAAPSC